MHVIFQQTVKILTNSQPSVEPHVGIRTDHAKAMYTSGLTKKLTEVERRSD